MQGSLEAAILAVTGQDVQVVGAGRTDTGVHATGQVAHFDIRWNDPAAVLLAALNATLDRDVAVTWIAPAPAGFHARYSAIGRAYRYTLWIGPVRSPLHRRTSLHVAKPLVVAWMADAAGRLEGEHDFGGFGRPMNAGGGTVRRMDRCQVRSEDHWIVFDLEANAFLRHQVRRTVGLLLDVGRGRLPPEAVESVLARAPDAPVPRKVPAQGLCLVAVRYPPDDEIEALAAGHVAGGPGARIEDASLVDGRLVNEPLVDGPLVNALFVDEPSVDESFVESELGVKGEDLYTEGN